MLGVSFDFTLILELSAVRITQQNESKTETCNTTFHIFVEKLPSGNIL